MEILKTILIYNDTNERIQAKCVKKFEDLKRTPLRFISPILPRVVIPLQRKILVWRLNRLLQEASRKFDWLLGVWEGWQGLGIAGRLRGGGQAGSLKGGFAQQPCINTYPISVLLSSLDSLFRFSNHYLLQLVARLDKKLIFLRSAKIFLFLRIQLKLNAALLSTFRACVRPSVTGVTSHISHI